MATDFKMIEDSEGIYDFTIDPVTGDFVTEDSFDTAILYSFYGERRASESEVSTSQNRRGWIGNLTESYENGSKVWIYSQARLTRNTLNVLNSESFNCWKWFLDDNLLKDITVQTDLVGGFVTVSANFVRFDSTVDKKFFTLWNNTGI